VIHLFGNLFELIKSGAIIDIVNDAAFKYCFSLLQFSVSGNDIEWPCLCL